MVELWAYRDSRPPVRWVLISTRPITNMLDIELKLSTDLQTALRERNAIAVKTLRALISEIHNAGAVIIDAPKIMPMAGGIAGATNSRKSSEVPRKEITVQDIEQIVRNEIEELTNTIEAVQKNAQMDTRSFVEQIEILKRYLR